MAKLSFEIELSYGMVETAQLLVIVIAIEV